MADTFHFIVPVLSLVDEHQAPQESLIVAHLAWLKSHGARGILVMGTTGEFPNFSVAQRMRYLEAITAHNPGLEVMVNVGAAAMADVLKLQRHAVDLGGINSLLWMPPFYYPDNHINGLARMLAEILAHQPEWKPFYLYHLPKMSQVSITPKLLAQFPQVSGMKDTSGDFERIAKITQQFPHKQIYAGTDYRIQTSRAVGCAGVISALSNVFPQLYQQALQDNPPVESTLEQLRQIVGRYPKMPALKAYLNHLGLCTEQAVSTLPFADLPVEERQSLIQAITACLPEAPLHAH